MRKGLQTRLYRFAELYMRYENVLKAGDELNLSRRSSFRYKERLSDLLDHAITILKSRCQPVTKRAVVQLLLEKGYNTKQIAECGISERYIREIREGKDA